MGREGIGVREIPWRVLGQPSSAGLKGDQVPGSAGHGRGKYWENSGSRIVEQQEPGTAEIQCVHEKNGDVLGSCFWTSSTLAVNP